MRLVYRVDSASAVLDNNRLIITVRGAVSSGGWDEPELLIRTNAGPEARTLEVRFMARPPSPREVVVQALLPISVQKSVPLPRYGTAEIEIVTESNTLIIPIMRYRAPFSSPRPGSR